MTSWFRSWHGAPTDTKWLAVARRANVAPGIVSAVAWAVLDAASQADTRGAVDGFDVEDYCAFSGFDEADVQAVIQALTDKGVIRDGKLAAWEKRQPEREDSSTERVRRYREKKRSETQGNDVKRSVTQCNAPEQNRTEQREKPPPNGGGKKRGTRIPDDFVPDLEAGPAAGLTPDETAIEAQHFADHFRAAPGQKGVRVDWQATWRNWCRTAKKWKDERNAQPANHPRQPARPESGLDQIGRALAERRARQAEARRREADAAGGGGIGPGDPAGSGIDPPRLAVIAGSGGR